MSAIGLIIFIILHRSLYNALVYRN